ncbi:MAG: PrsW family intramembrane metalloprotease [Patescibacteria group bacterium]
MKLLLCILLAPLPSIIWLAFYLRKDRHPEPNKLIVKIFLLGAMAIVFAALLEQGVYLGLGELSLAGEIILLVISFAFIEELLKYLVVKFGVLKNPSFDEPIDSMIYLIISALGFAAAENIYLLTKISPLKIPIGETIEFITTRFLGATLLHVLASAIVGYFLAASFCRKSKFRKTLVFGGLIAATILHSVFNYIIILNINEQIEAYQRNGLIFILLLGGAIMVSIMFKKINKFRSVCKL